VALRAPQQQNNDGRRRLCGLGCESFPVSLVIGNLQQHWVSSALVVLLEY
jgi:hypothetical protein